APRIPVPPTAELTPTPKAAAPTPRDPRFEPRATPPGLDMPPKPAAEGPGRDFRLEPRVAPPGREFSPKSPESPEVRPEPRVAAPPIDGSDELMPRERRPVAEGPRRPGDPPPPVVPESDEVTLSPRTPPSAPPPPRPALSLPPSIAEVFGSRSWSSESRPDATV